MASIRIEQLSPRERDCLRFVGQGLSSKEIAQQLQISPYTVDEYVRSAVGKLGARNRREAARLITAAGTSIATPPEELGDEPPTVAEGAHSAPAMPPVRSEEAPWWRFLPLRQGRRYNDLNALQRLLWILVGAVAIIFLFSQLSQGMQTIQSMFQGR